MPERDVADVVALVALLRVRPGGMTWNGIAAEVLEAKSAVEVWQHHRVQPTLLNDADDEALCDAQGSVATWDDAGLRLVTLLDPDYPAQLREIREAPPILFYRGALRRHDDAVSVVGSRRASPGGLENAAQVAGALTEHGLTVVAGLAAGIDTAAHLAALEAGGRTVAVIGTGINGCYPAANRALQERIGREGLLLSQFWPDAPPVPNNFRLRNATMSGYGIATVVVEAGETSGARIQARLAVEHGRPVILSDRVVTANAWARALVDRPGVHVASAPADVLDIVTDLRTDPGELLDTVLAARS